MNHVEQESFLGVGTEAALHTRIAKHYWIILIMTWKQLAVEMFKGEDLKYRPVDQRMCHNIISAGTKDKALRKQATLKEMERSVTASHPQVLLQQEERRQKRRRWPESGMQPNNTRELVKHSSRLRDQKKKFFMSVFCSFVIFYFSVMRPGMTPNTSLSSRHFHEL